MRPYAEVEVFEPREVELFREATRLVALVSEQDPEIRCHELARFVGSRLGLPVQDGHFGFVEHSWLWTGPQPQQELIWTLPNILDCYVPGALPQVQLIHCSSALPMAYRFGPPRLDIRHDVIATLQSSLPVATQ